MDMTDVCKGEENISVHAENFVDGEYLPEIKYTPFNVTGPGCEYDPCEVMYAGCECQQKSCGDDCPCIQRSLGQSYDDKGCLLSSSQTNSNSKPVLECNSSCTCSTLCTSRVVQNGIKFRVEVIRTEQKGWGLKALENIPRNRFVCEYAGEVLGYKEAHRRAVNMTEDDPNYILILKEHLQNGKVIKTCVDPTYVGNVGRYINHSCDPNLYMVAVRIDNEVPKLALFAKREILDEEELSFDYAGGINEIDINEMNTLCDDTQSCNESDTIPNKPCYCGADACRGLLPFDSELYAELDVQNASQAEVENGEAENEQFLKGENDDDYDLWKDELPNDIFLQLTSQLETKYEGAMYVNHSGGALGSDLFWQKIGCKYGIRTHAYSFEGHSQNNPARVELSSQDLKQADVHVHKANKVLHRIFPTQSNFINNLLRRDWFQVRDTECVFAVGKITKNRRTVEGGTGWTVQMAVDERKPVYVFDCKMNMVTKVTEGSCAWYKFDFKLTKFMLAETPILTHSFSGIGTRDLPERGKAAIREVFMKTFGH
ncbi:histone-lysine N-methyltransferase SETMAR-like [Glandiceps talaboti]